MKKLIKNIKLIAGVSTMLAVLAVAPVVYGGISWSGIDPVLKVNRHTFNVWVEWPEGMECSINGPISVTVHNKNAIFISESTEQFDCGGTSHTVVTETIVKKKGGPHNFVIPHVRVPASESFPVQTKVFKNGVFVALCAGQSNENINCDIVIGAR